MPFIPVLDTVEVELLMDLFGQRIENTLYFHQEGGFSPAQMVALGEGMQEWWAIEYATIVTEDVSLIDVIVTDLTSDTAPSIAIPAPTGTTGTLPIPTLPGSVCITMSFRTAGRGRSSRGRNYISGLGEAYVVANDAIASIIDAGITAYNNLLTSAYVPDPAEWVVVSRFTDNAPRVAGISIPITSVIVTDTAVDSQRRRLRGRGD